MATYKPSTNTDSTKVTYGTKGADVLALQKSLNAKGAGLKEDSMYGPLTQAAVAKYGGQASPAPGGLPPLGTIPDTDTAPTSNLGNLRLALSNALTEAAQTTAKNRIGQLSGLMGGGANPSVLKAAVGLAQGGLAQSKQSIVSDVMSAYEKTIEEERKRIEFNPDQFRSAQGGIYDLKNNKWIVTPPIEK